MARDSLFRNSIGGYNKEDVNRYIEELGIQYTDRENELEGEIRSLRKELEVLPSLEAEKQRAKELDETLSCLKEEANDLSRQLEDSKEELSEKSKALAEASAQRDAFDMRIRELCEENERLRTENAGKTAELERNRQETEQLKSRLEADRNDFEKRAEEMLLQIQAQAKAVIDKANETAELIIANAKKRASGVSKAPEAALSEPTAKKKDGLSDLLEGHKSRMDSFFSAITKTFMGDGR